MESDSTAPAASRTDDEDMTSSRNSAMNEHRWKDMFGSSDAFFSEVEAELEDCMDEANLLEEDAYDESTKLLHCMVCNETFRSRQGLLSHRLSHGDTEQDPEQQIERPITVSAMVARTSDYADDVENATEDNMLITEEDWCNNGAGPLESFCEHTIISSSSEMSDIICEISLSSRRENEESRSLSKYEFVIYKLGCLASSKFLSNAAIEGILEIIRISATASDEISSLLPKTADSFWNVFEKLSIKGSFIKKLQICEQEITVCSIIYLICLGRTSFQAFGIKIHIWKRSCRKNLEYPTLITVYESCTRL